MVLLPKPPKKLGLGLYVLRPVLINSLSHTFIMIEKTDFCANCCGVATFSRGHSESPLIVHFHITNNKIPSLGASFFKKLISKTKFF